MDPREKVNDMLWRMAESSEKVMKDSPILGHMRKGVALSHLRRYAEGFGHIDRAVYLARKGVDDSVEELRAYSGSGADREPGHDKRLKELKDAVAGAEKALETTRSYAHFNKGAAMADMRKYREAASHYEKAIELDPEEGEYYYFFAKLLYDVKMPSKSIKYFDLAIRLKCRYAAVYMDKARALKKCRRTVDALECLADALERHPYNANVNCMVASVYASLKDYRRAIKWYEAAVEYDPDHGKAHERLGAAYMEVRQDDMARPHLERALELAPGDPDVLEMMRVLEERPSGHRYGSGA